MYGLLLAFKRYDVNVGILKSPWTIKYIKQVVTMPGVLQVVRNTVRISLLKIIFGFPAPIILALLLNELKNGPFKRIVQTITYMPHFLSWVVVAGLITDILSIEGPLAYIRHLMGLQPIVYLVSKQYFIPIVIISSIWKGVGWGTIIYLATMSNINPELYESADIDGASRFKKAIYITVPSLTPVMTILLILNMGSILNAGFDQIFNLYNEMVYEVADIIDTYVYRIGLVGFEFSFSTAIGLVKNVIAFCLVFGTNMIVRKISDYTLW
jgi:putative aldouronate transport system permease protein